MYMKIHVDRKYEALTEAHSQRLVQAIFKYAKSTFRMKNGMDILVECGYAKRTNGKVSLVGYNNLCKFVRGLSKSELEQFFLFFVNTTHQAAYHLSEREIDDFIQIQEQPIIVDENK